jgi:hypothetical protein
MAAVKYTTKTQEFRDARDAEVKELLADMLMLPDEIIGSVLAFSGKLSCYKCDVVVHEAQLCLMCDNHACYDCSEKGSNWSPGRVCNVCVLKYFTEDW